MSLIDPLTQDALSVTLEPLVRATDGTVRGAVAAVVDAGMRCLQLDATLPGVRPRELSKRARQDLAALFTRSGVRLTGVDLFIPQRHFVEAAHLDRAMAALVGAMELCVDLGRVPLSLALPVSEMEVGSLKFVVESADGLGVKLAVHDERHVDPLVSWLAGVDLRGIGMGIDPAALIAAGLDANQVLHKHGNRVTVARLSDYAAGNRTPIGRGELDVTGYRIALDIAGKSCVGPVVLDLRGLSDPTGAMASGIKMWDTAGV
ncbi:MAG: TIM barrel protein [Phycisphaera sp.]|nr:TIM barrel protein [Phycisphaera sp.]